MTWPATSRTSWSTLSGERVRSRRSKSWISEAIGRARRVAPRHSRVDRRAGCVLSFDRRRRSRTSGRDRSYPASRSVVPRVEIGRTPRRDRSGSVSSLWCVITSEIGVSVWVVVVLGGSAARSRSPVPTCAGGGARQLPCKQQVIGRCPRASGAVQVPRADRGVRLPVLARTRGRGMVGVAHLRVLCVGGSRGIMRNSTVSSGRSPVPMCAGPPDRTWEPDHHTRRSPEKPTIPTKTSLHPAEVPVSCVQHRGQPHPLGTSGSLTTNPPQIRTGTRPILNAECGVSGHLRQFECLRCSDCGEVVSRLVGGY